METTSLGRSGLRVPRLGLGTLEWGGRVDLDAARELLGRYRDAGGSLVEVSSPLAPAIEMLGEIAAGEDLSALQIVGRSGVRRDPEGARIDTSRGGLLHHLDTMLATLGRDHLDLWILDAWDDEVPLEETVSALESAWHSGRARYLGLSHHSAWQIAAIASAVPITAVSMEHSLLHRSDGGEAVEACRHFGIGILAGAPLGRGVLSGRYATGVPADARGAMSTLAAYVGQRLGEREAGVVRGLLRASHGLDMSPVGIALAWVLAADGVSSALVGARTPEQLEGALESLDERLPEEILLALDEVSAD